MFKRRRRQNDKVNSPPPNSAPAAAAPDSAKPSPGPAGMDYRTKTQPVLTDPFKNAIEKAVDRAKSELSSKGKIEPMAFFMHEDGMMKVVSLVLRGGQQQETLILRIREKVLAENPFAVIVLTETDQKGRGMVFSGVTSGERASARLDYSFDKETKTVTSWKISWLNQPVRHILLDGIFEKSR
jgi:hypothetical protein